MELVLIILGVVFILVSFFKQLIKTLVISQNRMRGTIVDVKNLDQSIKYHRIGIICTGLAFLGIALLSYLTDNHIIR